MDQKLEHIRHTLAHLLAAAVLHIFPDAKPTIGPAIENGFYYDFDFSLPLSSDDLPNIEKEMRTLLKTWNTVSSASASKDEAIQIFAHNQYKKELISEIVERGDQITLYTWGDFQDLCRGGHAEDATGIDPECFALTHLAGAYWRGSEKNPMLTRIYGVAFHTKKERDQYLHDQEEAKKRDHRKIGKELQLFALIDEVGAGLPLFYPKGAILRRLVENFIIDAQERRGYEPIWIPHITKKRLYEISGHLQKYDALYPPMELPDEDSYYIKPMNCPHFMMLYKENPHSYREMPVRWTCTTTNYRYEKSGELSGLTRVRALTQDDCHVFCLPDQIGQEVNLMLDMIDETYRAFHFDNFWVRISTHDPENKEKYIGNPDVWTSSEESLTALIESRGWTHSIGVGEAAFYGPKLDFMAKDAIGREWQLSTIQLDMNLPERFELEYVADDNSKKRPVVIHRAILGSTERFLGVIIEHFAGSFPLWLSPVQVQIIPVGLAHIDVCKELAKKFSAHAIRVDVDESNETVGKKIRASEMQKVPYMIVIGDKEKDLATLAVRKRGERETHDYTLNDFIAQVSDKVTAKSLEL